MVKEIRTWLRESGLTGPSIQQLGPKLSGWATRLQENGVTEVLPPTQSRGRADDLVSNLLTLWVEEAKAPEDRDPVKEQELRNLIAAF